VLVKQGEHMDLSSLESSFSSAIDELEFEVEKCGKKL
jgi:hypothetical protein